MKTLLRFILTLAVLATLLAPQADAGQSVYSSRKFLFNNGGSTVAAAGGTYSPTIAVPTDQVMRLRATAIVSSSSGGHLQYGASWVAEYVVQNSNGTLATVATAANNFNPINSSTAVVTGATNNLTGEFVEADNHTNFNGLSTLVWSTSGTNAVITFTNNASAISVYVTIYVEAWQAGST